MGPHARRREETHYRRDPIDVAKGLGSNLPENFEDGLAVDLATEEP